MNSFKQTHSIAKRLIMTIMVIASFFLLEFVGMYFASQNTLTGLSELHQSIRSITQVRQLRTLLVSQQETLKKAATGSLNEDERMILKTTNDKIKEFYAQILELTRNSPDAYRLVLESQITLRPLTEVSLRLADGEELKVNALMVDQYILEAQDLLGKVQLVLADDSDEIFKSLYQTRFTPLLVGLVLSTLFLLFALWMGVNLKNRIERPVQRLIETTKELAGGNSGARAEISEPDEVGALTHAFNVMADRLEEILKQQKKAAEDLLQAKEDAEAANLAKSAFLANMSHEIRTPLGAVIGFAELVVDPQLPAAEKATFVAAIKRNGQLLSSIINDILDLSKIEADKMQIVTNEVELEEILTDTKTLLELQAKEKGIKLSVNVAPDVPKKIKTDSLRLRQVLINIIGNAIKFTAKGSVTVSIRMTSRGLLEFAVKDTGSGIREDQIDKLFAPFSQADASFKRKFGGTGLGLVLSKRFANMLGGDVVLTETRVDEGSTFTITIDPGQGVGKAQADGVKRVPSIKLKDGNLRLDGIRILLAEDSPDNQKLVTHLLKKAGAKVDIVNDGKKATEQAKSEIYDVILMDLQMPVMDGYEATLQLRREGYRGKIVALTAHALNEERERCLKMGFDDHISKPVNRDLLIERVYLCAHDERMQ